MINIVILFTVDLVRGWISFKTNAQCYSPLHSGRDVSQLFSLQDSLLSPSSL